MAKASPMQESFNAGELSPEVLSRVGTSKYAAGCSRLENFIPLVQGPARRRGGTRFVSEVKDSANRTWLAKFEFNVEQVYVLEFGNLYIRFYTDNGFIESSPGVRLEVVTPWTTADLINDEGTFALQMAQSGDILFICHPNYAPRKLSRFGPTTWTLTEITTLGGPFHDLDPDNTVTLYASSSTGATDLTASSGVWATTDVGRLFYLENKRDSSISPWEPGKVIGVGALRSSDGKTYKALTAATTGSVRPLHTFGAKLDGFGAVKWEFQDPGYGYVKITGYTFSFFVQAQVLSPLPVHAVGSGDVTTRWAFGAWGSVSGYPSHVAFFKNRIVFCRSRDRAVWMSVAADFVRMNFNDRDDGGVVTADMSVSLTIESTESNRIQSIIALSKALLIFTADGERFCAEQNTATAFGPGNFDAPKMSGVGSRSVTPININEAVLFVQRSGRGIKEIRYNVVNDGPASIDMSVLATHLVPKGKFIVQMAYQSEPNSMLWVCRSDGLLLGFTYNREQFAEPPFGGWARFPIGGDGIVESILTIPSPDNGRNDLWLIVRRTINSVTRRYIEFMQPEFESGDNPVDAFYVDSGLTYNGAPATTISGLGHLEGKTVDILSNGAAHPQRTVTAGAVTLQQAGSVVHVGLPCPCKLATARLEAGSLDGTAQGKVKRISKMTMRFIDTLGGRAGPAETKTDEILFRGGDPMDAPPPLFSGDKTFAWPGGYETDAIVWYVNDQPLPVTISAIMPTVTTYDK